MGVDGHYQTNSKVLKFKINTESNKIIFNHYISQKENFQRIAGNLPRGQFYMTINATSIDLKITFGEARGLIKKFTDLGIITNVYTPAKGCKNSSIWEYNSSANNEINNEECSKYNSLNVVTNNDNNNGITNNDNNNDINNDINNEECSKYNRLSVVTNNEINNDDNNDINNSKKEYIKRIYKNTISPSESGQVDKKYLEIFNHWNMEGITQTQKLTTEIKKGVDAALKLKKEDDSQITIKDIKSSISNYAEVYKMGLFTYQWRLVEFLKRKQRDTGMHQLLLFLDNGTTYLNYKAKLTKTATISKSNTEFDMTGL